MTSVFLLASCVIIANNIWFGRPIVCTGGVAGFETEDLEAFCLIHGVKMVRPQKDTDGAHFDYGVQELRQKTSKFNGLYKWTMIILLIQSVLFYAPHLLWKTFEDGWIANITKDLTAYSVVDENEAKTTLKLVAQNFNLSTNLNMMYGIVLLLTEIMNLVNVTLHFFTYKTLLSNIREAHPLEILREVSKNPNERTDSLDFIFPKKVSCTSHSFGHSGTVEIKDFHCEVPVNYLNEGFFLLIFYWLLILFICSAFHLIVVTTLSHFPKSQKCTLQNICKGVDEEKWDKIFDHLGIFDRLVLRILITEMNQLTAKNFVNEVANTLKKPTS